MTRSSSGRKTTVHLTIDRELREEIEKNLPRPRGYRLPLSALVEDLLRSWLQERKTSGGI